MSSLKIQGSNPSSSLFSPTQRTRDTADVLENMPASKKARVADASPTPPRPSSIPHKPLSMQVRLQPATVGEECRIEGTIKVGQDGKVTLEANVSLKLEDGTFKYPMSISLPSASRFVDGSRVTLTGTIEQDGSVFTMSPKLVAPNLTRGVYRNQAGDALKVATLPSSDSRRASKDFLVIDAVAGEVFVGQNLRPVLFVAPTQEELHLKPEHLEELPLSVGRHADRSPYKLMLDRCDESVFLFEGNTLRAVCDLTDMIYVQFEVSDAMRAQLIDSRDKWYTSDHGSVRWTRFDRSRQDMLVPRLENTKERAFPDRMSTFVSLQLPAGHEHLNADESTQFFMRQVGGVAGANLLAGPFAILPPADTVVSVKESDLTVRLALSGTNWTITSSLRALRRPTAERTHDGTQFTWNCEGIARGVYDVKLVRGGETHVLRIKFL